MEKWQEINYVDFKIIGGIQVNHNEASDGISFAGGFFGEATIAKISNTSVDIQNGIITTKQQGNIGTAAGYIGKMLNSKEKNYYLETATIKKPTFNIQAANITSYIGNLKIKN